MAGRRADLRKAAEMAASTINAWASRVNLPDYTHVWRAPAVWNIPIGGGGSAYTDMVARMSGATPAQLWSSQPHLRTVVDFLARNVAQLGLHVYERQDDGGRVRVDDSAAARALRAVDGEQTTYGLIYATVGDFQLYDVAYWWVLKNSDAEAGYSIRRIPVPWVSANGTSPMHIESYDVTVGGKVFRNQPVARGGSTGIMRLGGYSPEAYLHGSPKVWALRDTLVEQMEAALYRGQVWKNGGRVSAVLERPVEADPWTKEARDAFREDWYAKWTGQGPNAGGTPILEDGMKLTRVDFNAREQQFVEAAKLALQTVASAYHVNPTMIGYTDGANYSNVKAYSVMLYTDTLGPILQQMQQWINCALLPVFGMDTSRFYVEFNIAEKLAGSFEERASVMSSSVGAPWLTPNEARAMQNLPAIDGGDQLVVPLNVTSGAQASPRDTGDQNRVPGSRDRLNAAPTPSAKAAEDDEDGRQPSEDDEQEDEPAGPRGAATEDARDVLATFFARQARALRSRKASAVEWDTERWNNELAHELLKVSRTHALRAARAAMEANGDDPDDYSEARTIAYLTESSARKAEAINTATRDALEDALDAQGDDGPDPYAVTLEDGGQGRADAWGAVVAGFAVGFGAVEAARQRGGTQATKTWRTTSRNPRDSHKRLNGEVQPIDGTFSNGLDWPGSLGDPDEVAGCRCEVDVEW